MTCSSCLLSGRLLHSRSDHAPPLPNGRVTDEAGFGRKHVFRRKLRFQTSCAASWLANGKESELQIAEPASTQPQPVQSSAIQQNPLIAAVAVVAVILLLAVRALTRKSQAGKAQSSKKSQDIEPELTADSKDFKVAVARTRQAVSVQKAIGFMDASSPAKAIVELRRALEENSVARASILNTRYEGQDLLNLYKLHLQNTEMPPNFATLLQLREMLAISDVDAERLEKDVFESGAAFSI